MTVATDWLAAVGTVGTLAATVVLYDLDRRHRRKSTKREQARKVSAWSRPVAAGATHREVVVSNLSDEPVYDINVFVAPRRYGPGQTNTFFCSLLPPSETFTRQITRSDPSVTQKTVPRVELTFTDRDGVRWLRDRNGNLREIESDDPDSHRRQKQK